MGKDERQERGRKPRPPAGEVKKAKSPAGKGAKARPLARGGSEKQDLPLGGEVNLLFVNLSKGAPGRNFKTL
jgi:hypothetical protein